MSEVPRHLVVPGAGLHSAEVTLKPQNSVCTQIIHQVDNFGQPRPSDGLLT